MAKKFLYSFLVLFTCALFAQENKLDELDKQSAEFFNAITGLEKTYLEEQIKKRKKTIETNLEDGKDVVINGNVQKVTKISQEQLERNILENENTKVKLGSDIARSKNIKDIMIKSMYTFNGKNYVVLTQSDDLTKNNATSTTIESSLNIEGRYKKGDLILNHRIVYINTRTKTVTLYKKVDDEYGYFIYLNNETLTVSDLKKIVKDDSKKEKVKLVSVKKEPKPAAVSKTVDSNNDECIYTLKVNMLNIRANRDLDGKILKVLDKGDKVKGQVVGNVLKIDTIYRISGTTVKSEDNNYWVSLTKERFNANKENCF